MKKIFTAVFFCAVMSISACAPNELHVNRLFPLGSPPAKVIDVADIMAATPDVRLAAFTLQGLVNGGKEAKVYFIAETNCKDQMWLDLTKKEGHIDSYNLMSIDDLFEKYSDHYSKVIVYDADLPNTINIATMMASVENGIVISKEDIGRFGKEKKVVDLTGRWKTNVEAYEWAYENLFDKMSKEVMACFHPTGIPHNIRDYLVANKVFTFWVTGKAKEDKVKSDHEKEKAFAEKVFAKYPPNTPALGFWYSGADSGIDEYTGVGISGQYGILSHPADWNTNLSFHSGIKLDWTKIGQNYNNSRTEKNIKPKKDKMYVCFAITDSGDAPMYWQAAEYMVWQDKKMGKIPINWSLGVGCIELTPVIVKWFFDNMPPEDRFFIGYSGLGYTHPYRDLFGKTKDPKKAWKEYFKLTDEYMDILEIPYVCLYTDAWFEFDRKKKDPLTARFADNLPGTEAFIMGMGRDEGMTAEKANYLIGKNDVLVSHVLTRWDAASVGVRSRKNNQWLADEIKKHSPKSKAGLMMVHPISWSYYASDLVEVMDMLGKDYEVVSLPTFVKMAKELDITN